MMTDWYEKMIKALQLKGKGERTQQAYARAVRMLTEFSGKPPDDITEEEPSRQVKEHRRQGDPLPEIQDPHHHRRKSTTQMNTINRPTSLLRFPASPQPLGKGQE